MNGSSNGAVENAIRYGAVFAEVRFPRRDKQDIDTL
jgi:hypothetical protein